MRSEWERDTAVVEFAPLCSLRTHAAIPGFPTTNARLEALAETELDWILAELEVEPLGNTIEEKRVALEVEMGAVYFMRVLG